MLLITTPYDFSGREHGQRLIRGHLNEGFSELAVEELIKEKHAVQVPVLLPLSVLCHHAQSPALLF